MNPGGVRAPGGLRRLQSGRDGRSPSGGFDSRPPPPHVTRGFAVLPMARGALIVARCRCRGSGRRRQRTVLRFGVDGGGRGARVAGVVGYRRWPATFVPSSFRRRPRRAPERAAALDLGRRRRDVGTDPGARSGRNPPSQGIDEPAKLHRRTRVTGRRRQHRRRRYVTKTSRPERGAAPNPGVCTARVEGSASEHHPYFQAWRRQG